MISNELESGSIADNLREQVEGLLTMSYEFNTQIDLSIDRFKKPENL